MPATPAPNAEHLTEALVTEDSLWREVRVVSESPSTNADLVAAARLGGVAAGTVLITDNQTAGRGRFTRSWTAAPGVSTAMSILVRPDQPLQRWGWLSLISGVAVARGLQVSTGVPATVKWPNDVLIDERKISGMIAERIDTPEGPAAVVGIGINVSMSEEELPVPTATSLLLQGVHIDKTAMLIAVLREFEVAYAQWDANSPALTATYAQACSTIGRRVRVLRSETDVVEGLATGIDAGGSLLVQVGDQVEAFSAGDVLHLR